MIKSILKSSFSGLDKGYTLVKGWPRLFGAIIYEISGALIGRMAFGHNERFFSYGLQPLFLLLILTPKLNFWRILGASAILTMDFFSGDVYSLWYTSIFFVSLRLYYFIVYRQNLIKEILKTLVVYLLFLLLSLPRLIPFIVEAAPHLERFEPINPFIGSIHFLFVPLIFMIPFNISMSIRQLLFKTLGMGFNIYEYLAFISPLLFVFLFKLKKILTNHFARALLFILLVGFLYVASRFPYSPFYWLFKYFPALHLFRTPQRMMMSLTSLMVALLSLGAYFWWKETKNKFSKVLIICLMMLSIGWVFIDSRVVMLQMFEPKREKEERLVARLRQEDAANYFVADFVCCLQGFLVKAHIPIINYYYGWRPKEVPNFLKQDKFNYAILEKVRPKYLISKGGEDFSRYSYRAYFSQDGFTIWKTNNPNITPKL
ncbi:hypothetical protein HY030_00255 [Candidatus Gottesmanbacteria bacterium]|nr:hypothetical protein [Candidatus Gottesmanbacteria bacterium]